MFASDEILFSNNLAAVALVLGLLIGLLWLLRGKGMVSMRLPGKKAPAEKRLKIVERVPLTAQNAIFLVEADGVSWLIGSSPSGMTVQEMAQTAQPAVEPKPQAETEETELQEQLQSAMRQFEEARRVTAASRGANGRYRTAADYLD